MVMIKLMVAALYIITKVTGLTPADKFDLANWKLTLPTVDSDGVASEIYPIDLTNHYQSEYFYIDTDGAMTFYTTNGGTTPNSKYPRSELRQLCNPDSSDPEDYNWPIYSYNYVEGTYRIGELDDPTGRKVIIQQIHAYDAPPLVKIQYQSGGKVYALIKTDASGDTDEKPLLGQVDGNETFILKTTVDYGYLKLYFNDELVVTREVGSFWSNYSNYFKAGNYMQSNDNGTYSYVHIYDLDVYTSSGSCQFSDGAFTTTMVSMDEDEVDDEDSYSTLITYIAVLITILVVLVIAIAVLQYWCYKNNQCDATKGNKIQYHHATANSGLDAPVGNGGNSTNSNSIEMEPQRNIITDGDDTQI